jgi:hypothetical protein
MLSKKYTPHKRKTDAVKASAFHLPLEYENGEFFVFNFEHGQMQE